MADAALHDRLTKLWATDPGFLGSLATVDHKKIGVRYLVTATIFLLLGGIEALVMRAQLAGPETGLISPEAYNQLFTMHGVTMIFWYAAPILSGFGNYLIPLMLGARDMSFPRLNAFTYWVFLFSGILLYGGYAFGYGPHAGWFAYAPYTNEIYSPGMHMDFYALALIFLTISQTAGAINFLVTIFRQRPPGMAISRMPLFMYSTATISVLSIVALPALTAGCLFLELDRHWGTHFFDMAQGGSATLWQHTFWFFAHPWVYIIFLPATGIVSMIVPVFARRPIVGYVYIAVATVLTGVVGMGVWAHHMFAVGMSQLSMSYFSAASMTISLFTAVQVFAWLGTLWTGRPVMANPLRFVLGFLALLIIGGLNGVITAAIPFDWQLTDTYFIVAHIHYVIIGANVFPVFAAFYYWLPKISGRMMNETAGRVSFWLMFVGVNLAFVPMHLVGLAGMPRRIYTYGGEMGWDLMNLLITAGAGVFALGVLVSMVNFLVSIRSGRPAGRNPWGADTLEWDTTSPPAVYGHPHVPTVRSRHPLWDDHDEQHDPSGERVLDHARLTFATSALDGKTVGLSRMPVDTLAPLLVALALMGIFTALLFQALWAALGMTVAALGFTAFWNWPQRED